MLAQEIYEMLVWASPSKNLRDYLTCSFHRCVGVVEICVSGDVAMARAVSVQLPKAIKTSKLTITEIPSKVFAWRCSIQLTENPVKTWKEIRSFMEKVLGLEFKLYRPKTFEKEGFDAAFKGLFRDMSEELALVLLYNPSLLHLEITNRLEAVERIHTMAQDQCQVERAQEMNVFAVRFRALRRLASDYLLK